MERSRQGDAAVFVIRSRNGGYGVRQHSYLLSTELEGPRPPRDAEVFALCAFNRRQREATSRLGCLNRVAVKTVIPICGCELAGLGKADGDNDGGSKDAHHRQ